MALNKKDILAFLEKYKWIILIILLGIYLSNTEPITSPQKEISLTKPGTYKFIQLGGLAATLGGITKLIPGWGLAIGAALVAGPWLVNNWINIFQPDPVIPTWVFIAGFIILALFVLKGQRRS